MSEEDIFDNRNPVHNSEMVDQLIITPEARTTVMKRKIPNFKKIPIFELDANGNKIPILDEDGNEVIDEFGEKQYVVKEYEKVRDGWTSKNEEIPASEMFTIDLATSSISQDAVKLMLELMWDFDDHLALQQSTDDDYSVVLHKLRNDTLSIPNAAKSYNGSTISSIKTYRNINDSRQMPYQPESHEEPQKLNPFDAIFGGKKKPQKKKDVAFNW